jgi:hypothetical protein
MRKMFNAKEIVFSNWDGKYPIDLEKNRGEGKTTCPIGITI